MYRILSTTVSGVFLISISVALLWVNLPIPISPGIAGYSYVVGTPLAGWGDYRLQRKLDESDRDFVIRLNKTIFASIYHCNYDATPRLIDKLVALIQVDHFKNGLGFLTPVMLKCGLCSQVSYVLARALNLGGVKAVPLSIGGHVVTLVHLENQDWIADPDFGVGLFKYEDNMWNKNKESYSIIPKSFVQTYSELEKAFETTADDQPFYNKSMDWLNNVEFQQRMYIKIFEFSAYGIGLLGLALVIYGVFIYVRRSYALADHVKHKD